jgi:hypothetical protein
MEKIRMAQNTRGLDDDIDCQRLIERYFSHNDKQSIRWQILDMVDSHITYKTIVYIKENEPDKELVAWNKPLNKMLNAGYVSTQALYIRNLTQPKSKRNTPLSIPAFLHAVHNSFPTSIIKLLPNADLFKNNTNVKNIRDFSDQYVAHIDRNRKTAIPSLTEYIATIEKCHEAIISAVINIYGKLMDAHMCPVIAYQENTSLDGHFCSDAVSKKAYNYRNELAAKYQLIGSIQ